MQCKQWEKNWKNEKTNFEKIRRLELPQVQRVFYKNENDGFSANSHLTPIGALFRDIEHPNVPPWEMLSGTPYGLFTNHKLRGHRIW